MKINFNTKNLIVLNYPRGAGGKFISLALAVHPRVLIQEEKMARLMMRRGADKSMGFNLAMKTFEKSEKINSHFEFGCEALSGFNAEHLVKDLTADEKVSNDLWKELTNQDKFYFFMVDHSTESFYSRYKNRKTIRLINYDWIMKDRRIDKKVNLPFVFEENLDRNLNDLSITFNMESIKDSILFVKEVNNILSFLGLDVETDSTEQIEKLRKRFMETFKTGFNKGETNDR